MKNKLITIMMPLLSMVIMLIVAFSADNTNAARGASFAAGIDFMLLLDRLKYNTDNHEE